MIQCSTKHVVRSQNKDFLLKESFSEEDNHKKYCAIKQKVARRIIPELGIEENHEIVHIVDRIQRMHCNAHAKPGEPRPQM